MLQKAQNIAARLMESGARDCLMVGGSVRDHLMGLPQKDVDLEVYGLDYDAIVSALRPHYQVNLVGKTFGVVKVDNSIDVSIPRRENKMGLGHRGFKISTDPRMSYREAAARRDFTVNSIMMRFDGTIIDPFDGQKDISHKILRATSSAFREDPLRVLRGMQFASRLGFDMESQTIEMCREISGEFRTLSADRLWDEWLKWSIGKFPAKGLTILEETGWIVHFPQLQALTITRQDPEYHPEGNVWQHTCYVCSAAVEIGQRRGFTNEEQTITMFAALLHDAGKPSTTVEKAGRILSPGHAEAGVAVAASFLKSIKAPGKFINYIKPLVAEHMVHLSTPANKAPSKRTVRRLAHRLSPANIRLWAGVCEADHSGRPPKPPGNPVKQWEEVAGKLQMQDSRPKAILTGKHLIEHGMSPGKEMGTVLKQAFEAQLDGLFNDLDGALKWIAEQDINHSFSANNGPGHKR